MYEQRLNKNEYLQIHLVVKQIPKIWRASSGKKIKRKLALMNPLLTAGCLGSGGILHKACSICVRILLDFSSLIRPSISLIKNPSVRTGLKLLKSSSLESNIPPHCVAMSETSTYSTYSLLLLIVVDDGIAVFEWRLDLSDGFDADCFTGISSNIFVSICKGEIHKFIVFHKTSHAKKNLHTLFAN